MTSIPTLEEGEQFVEGRSQETARELLDLAEKAGLEGSVRTTSFGYIVPSAIFDTVTESSDDKDVDPNLLAELEAEKAAAAQAEAEKAAADAADENPEGSEFDPTTATVDAIKEYLDGADDTERERVLAAEAASAKPRKGVLELATTPEGAK